jgi:hypothetical protein
MCNFRAVLTHCQPFLSGSVRKGRPIQIQIQKNGQFLCNREGGATLPWSEDWAWQSPMGSQQMVTLLIDVMRSAVTKHAEFDREQPYGE